MIGLISDTHDNLPAIQQAVGIFNSNDVELVLHAGDFVSPFTCRPFKDLKAPMQGVFGNNDGDKATLIEFFSGIADLHQSGFTLDYEGLKILISHQPLSYISEDIDVYVFGHTHEPFIEKENILKVNPGECSGWLSSKNTIALLDTEKLEAELVEF